MQHLPKYLCFFLLFLFFNTCVFAQNYWQQKADYSIHVSLNDIDKTLDANETINYTNNSPDTLHFIWFHLWMNAYKNDRTAFSEQLLRNSNTSFYWSDESQRGYINGLDFTINGTAANIVQDSANIDIIKVMMPQPLAPSQSIIIATPFHVKLPYNFSRGGYEGQTFQLTQWYPKPAVYDRKGWHQMAYLDQGEFYSEFGNFDVTITLPQNYIVASSGALQNRDELEKLKILGKQNPDEQNNYKLWNESFKLQAIREKKGYEEIAPVSSSTLKTLHYQLNNVHDFAWFASKLFLVQYDTIQLKNHTADAFTFYNPWNKTAWTKSLQYVKDGVHFYSDKLGDYPYDEASAVLGKSSKETGGMEYPTITLLEMSDAGKELDATITHEIGHNWLYGILANNERDHAWMDEGMNTYYENRYINGRYTAEKTKDFINKKLPRDEDTITLETLIKLHKDQPIDITSDSLTETNYGLSVYSKGAMWMKNLEQQFGVETFDSCMHNYFRQWQFKHPYPEDFKKSFEGTSGASIDTNYRQLFTTGSLFPANKKSLKITGLFNLNQTNKYNYLSISPAVGYNYYDQFMIGGLIHNYQFPLNKFNFLLAPLYSTGSKQVNGAARFSYSIYSKRKWIDLSLSNTKYSIDEFTQYNSDKLYFGVTRIVPSVKYTLYNKDLRSAQRWTFQLRDFILLEDGFGDFTTVETPTDTFFVANKKTITTNIAQLKISVSDNRKLYPYNANLTIDEGKTFVRAGFTGNYFFNYKENGKGISARFFAGKFFYLQQKTIVSKSENSRYLLTLSGANGNEDYTYSDYFIGRNEQQGGLSQQIMQRDGFFKVSTPFLNSPVGKTDDWLLSLNISGDIPKEINPLNVLPFDLPLQIFADVGTYSDVWKDETATGRFLFDAGVKISIVHSAFSVYLPLVYSKVYKDYYQSFYPQKRFAHTIAFSFDMQQLQPNKLNRKIPL